jgi:glycosyltransferase involved in cell wall biosynthesis
MDRLFVILVSHKHLFSEIGGIESMAGLLLRKFQRSQGSIGVVCQGFSLSRFVCSRIFSFANPVSAFARKNTYSSPSPKSYSYLLYTIKELLFSLFAVPYILKLIKVARQEKLDPVLFAFDTVFGGVAASFASKLSGVSLISETHGLRQDYIKKITANKLLHFLDFSLEKFVVKSSVFLVSVNKQALDFWFLQGVAAGKLKLMRVPIDLEVFRRDLVSREVVREKMGIERDTFTIGFVGRLSKEKNVETLMYALSKAVTKYQIPRNSKLLLVGNGPEMCRLKEIASSIGLSENVIFAGFRHDVHKLINGVDVFVLPSSVEGNPTVVLEAMATEVPVLASSIPANVELISHMQDGLLFKEGEVNELEGLLSFTYQNRILMAKLGKAGKAKVCVNNDVNVIVEKFTSLFNEASLISNSKLNNSRNR